MDYRSNPNGFSSTPPRPSSPDAAVRNPDPTSFLPERPQSPVSSRSSTGSGNIISAFISSNTISVTNAFETRQSTHPMKYEPESTIAKDVPTSISTASNAQAQKAIMNTEQVANIVTSHRKPSLEVVKEQVAAAKRRLEDITNRKKNALPRKPEEMKVKPEHSPESKETPSFKPETAQNAQPVHSQHKKENVIPSSDQAKTGATTSIPRTALCHLPEKTVVIKDTRADVKSEMGTSLPTTARIASTENATKSAVQPTVVFLRPGKINVEARSSNGVKKPAKFVERSANSIHVTAQNGSQKCGQQESLGLKYLSSVSPEEHMDQKPHNLPLLAPEGPKGSLAIYRQGGLIKPEPVSSPSPSPFSERHR